MTSLIHIPSLLNAGGPGDGSPWARWAMKGARFKLLSAEPATGRFTLLIDVAAGAEAPPHRHLGAVEGMVLSGSFHYREDPETVFGAGSYLFEPAGSVHQPVSAQGALMLAVFHGPVEGLDDAGQVTGRIDCAWHVRAWNEAATPTPETEAPRPRFGSAPAAG